MTYYPERFHRRVSDLFRDPNRTPTGTLATLALRSEYSEPPGEHYAPRPNSDKGIRGGRWTIEMNRYTCNWPVRSVETVITARPIRPDKNVLAIEDIVCPATVRAVTGSNDT